jgi:hypothetical protein
LAAGSAIPVFLTICEAKVKQAPQTSLPNKVFSLVAHDPIMNIGKQNSISNPRLYEYINI